MNPRNQKMQIKHVTTYTKLLQQYIITRQTDLGTITNLHGLFGLPLEERLHVIGLAALTRLNQVMILSVDGLEFQRQRCVSADTA